MLGRNLCIGLEGIYEHMFGRRREIEIEEGKKTTILKREKKVGDGLKLSRDPTIINDQGEEGIKCVHDFF